MLPMHQFEMWQAARDAHPHSEIDPNTSFMLALQVFAESVAAAESEACVLRVSTAFDEGSMFAITEAQARRRAVGAVRFNAATKMGASPRVVDAAAMENDVRHALLSRMSERERLQFFMDQSRQAKR